LKKFKLGIFIILIFFIFSGCESRVRNLSSSKPLTKGEFQVMLDEPEKYKSRPVDFYGKLYVLPGKIKNSGYFVLLPNPRESTKSIVVEIANSKLNIEFATQDILHVKGIVEGKNKKRNNAGVVLEAPYILAGSIEKEKDLTVFYPAYKVINYNQKQTIDAFTITIGKIELAEKETRIYISITNELDEEIIFSDYPNYLSYGSKKEHTMNSNQDQYPSIYSYIPAKATKDGILLFPAIDRSVTEAVLSIEGAGYRQTEPLIFTIQL
jgi:hypothetical protein